MTAHTNLKPERFLELIRNMANALILVELHANQAEPRMLWSKNDALFPGNLKHTAHGIALLSSAIEKSQHGQELSQWERKAVLRFQTVVKLAYRACVYAEFYRERFAHLAGVAEAIDRAMSASAQEQIESTLLRMDSLELDELMECPEQKAKKVNWLVELDREMADMVPLLAGQSDRKDSAFH